METDIETFCKYIVLETLHAPHWNGCIICYCGYSCSPDGTIYVFKCSMNARIDLAAIRAGIVIVGNIACRFSISKLKIPWRNF